MPDRDPYAVLGVRSDATVGEIREAYLRRSKDLHPDRFAEASDTDRAAVTRAMQELNAAYSSVRDGPPPILTRPAAPPPATYRAPRKRRWPLIIAAAMLLTAVAVALSGGSNPAERPPPRDDIDLTQLIGECITLRVDGEIDALVDCTRPHDARVVAVVDHPTPCPIWSDAHLAARTQDVCLDRV